METLAPSQVIYPFGKINIWRQTDGSKKVRAYIIVERPFEGAKTGIAIDGSASLRPSYGYPGGLFGVFSNKTSGQNLVSTQAQKMAAYLARTLDVDSTTSSIYWATGSGQDGIEPIGDFNETQASLYDFKGPQRFGARTRLTPALKYFVQRFKSSKWGMFIFITDGIIDDLNEVKDYTTQLAKEIEAKTRNPLKLILIGVGPDVEEKQMTELDDLDTGTSIDLWDHKIASEMSQLAEIFTEVVDEKIVLSENGLVRDSKGGLVHDFRDTGLSALMEFTLPSNACDAFTLELGGQIIRQPLP
jgi:hypothetical protein